MPATVYTLPMFLAAALMALMALYAWRRRLIFGAITFSFFLIPIGLWALGAAFEILAPGLPEKLFWAKFQYLGIAVIPVLWLLFTLEYSGAGRTFGRTTLLISVIPVVTIVLVWSNALHGLIWSSIALDRSMEVPYLKLSHGLWFLFVHTPFSYGLILMGVLVLVRHAREHADLERWRTILLIVAALVPAVVNGYYLLWPIRPPFDPTPLGLTVSGLITAWALLRYRLFEVIPIAYRTVFQNLPDTVVVVDEEDRVLAVNPTAESTLGIRQANVRGRIAGDIVPFWTQLGDVSSQLLDIDTDTDPGVPGGSVRRADQSEPISFEVQRTPLLGPRGQVMGSIVIARNVSQLKRFERRADFDPLTGIANRRRFWEDGSRALSLAVRERWRVAVLYLDLDRFKPINDRFGHSVGDQVLRQLTERLGHGLRQGDLFARFGGDEFIMLLHNASRDSVRDIAGRLLSEVEQPFSVGGLKVSIGASIGVAFYPDNALHLGDLVGLADQAMYEAKANGLGLCFSSRGSAGATLPPSVDEQHDP